MKFGMNLLLWTTHLTEKQSKIVEKIAEVGYDGVEVPLFEGKAAHYTEMRGLLESVGFDGCSGVTVMSAEKNPASSDAKIRQAGLDHIKWAIDMTAALGGNLLCGPLHSGLGVFSGKAATKDELKWSADVLRQAGEHASDLAIQLAVEYLNRFENYLLTTAEQCHDYVDRVGHPSVGMMWDTFHAHIEETDSPKALKGVAEAVIHVHISENDRGEPGTGQVDWDDTFKQLKKAKYDGWLTIEAFGRALPDLAAATRVWRDLFESPEDVYVGGLKFMKKMWKKA